MYCRLCAKLQMNLIPEQTNTQCLNDSDFKEKVKKCVNVDLTEDDSLPKYICNDCGNKVSNFYQFLQQVIDAQTILVNLLAPSLKPEVSFEDDGPLEAIEALSVVKVEEDKPADANDNIKEELSEPPIRSKSQRLANKRRGKVKRSSSTKKPAKNRQTKDGKEQIRPKKLKINVKEETEDVFEESKTAKLYLKHYKWHCSECDKIIDNVHALRDHYLTCHVNVSVKYLCNDCPKTYERYDLFKRHLKAHRDKHKFVCGECGKNFYKRSHMVTHEQTHLPEKNFECDVCHKRFKTKATCQYHRAGHFKAREKKMYRCNVCFKVLSTGPNLCAHMLIHKGIRQYTCELCGRSFMQKVNLVSHIATVHTDVTPFKCDLCTRSFKTMYRLKRHSKIHTGTKNHKCETCGKCFRESGTLKTHLQVHTTELPYECEHCKKRFKLRNFLRIHLRQHTGERPYSCPECSHEFTNWSNYNKHMLGRHNRDMRSLSWMLIQKHQKGLANQGLMLDDQIKVEGVVVNP